MIASVQFETLAPGVATFTSEPADDSNSEVLLYFEDDRVPATATSYGTASLSIAIDSTARLTAPDTFTVNGATPQRLDVRANDPLLSGNPVTLTSVTQPTAGGTVAVDAGQVLFTPATGFSGTSRFTYTVTNSAGATQVENVTVTVNNSDAAPIAVDDVLTVAEDAPATTLNVTANDTLDADDQAITVTAVSQGTAGGTVAISGDGTSINYTPAANFNGIETATYTIRDSGGGQSTATITFTVTAVDDAPVAADRSASALVSDVDKIVLRADSFANVDGGETLRFVNVSAVTGGGTATVSEDGQLIRFTPAAGATAGTSTLTFQLSDGTDPVSAAATLTIDVRDFNPRDFTFNFNRPPSTDELAALTLQGTDVTGGIVTLGLMGASVIRNGNQVTVTNQSPGSFRLDVPDNPFFNNRSASQSLTIESGVDDGDASLSVELGSVAVEYLTMNRWFGSAPRRTVLAVVSPGQAAVAMQANAAVNDLANIGVNLNAAADSVTVRADRTSGSATTAVTGSGPVGGGRAARQLAQIGDQRLVEINLDDDGVPLRTAPATAAATASPGSGGSALSAAAIAPDDGRGTGLNLSQRTQTPIQREVLNVPPTSSTSSSSVDAAMADVLPELQLRSPAGESTADQQPIETFAEAADRVFTGL